MVVARQGISLGEIFTKLNDIIQLADLFACCNTLLQIFYTSTQICVTTCHYVLTCRWHFACSGLNISNSDITKTVSNAFFFSNLPENFQSFKIIFERLFIFALGLVYVANIAKIAGYTIFVA